MTNRELIEILRDKGKVFAPVLVPNDVMYMEVVKADVLDHLGQGSPDDEAPWGVEVRDTGFWLDTNEVYR